tara:strand:- start:77 stop:442 length:366 start_codon:yes stop_codon:yes gene_type:complete
MPDNRQCALYIVQDTQSGDVKIGISNNPKERKKEIQVDYNVGQVRGISITWFLTRKEALLWESRFHKKYKHQHSPERGGKEWFSLSEYEIKSFIEWMKKSREDRDQKIQILKELIHKEESE